jgi:hypothetical protein
MLDREERKTTRPQAIYLLYIDLGGGEGGEKQIDTAPRLHIRTNIYFPVDKRRNRPMVLTGLFCC